MLLCGGPQKKNIIPRKDIPSKLSPTGPRVPQTFSSKISTMKFEEPVAAESQETECFFCAPSRSRLLFVIPRCGTSIQHPPFPGSSVAEHRVYDLVTKSVSLQPPDSPFFPLLPVWRARPILAFVVCLRDLVPVRRQYRAARGLERLHLKREICKKSRKTIHPFRS